MISRFTKKLKDIFRKVSQHCLGGTLILSLGILIFSLGEVKGQCVITENTAGVHTFIVPAGVTEITVETWGAGGRGGSRTNNGGSGGGGGGGYSRSIISVTPGETYSYTVGAGGAVGSINGGISRFYLGATDHVLANGGIGTNNNSNTAGTGATTSGAIGNQETKPGGAGASGNTSRGGGGGSSGNLGENGVAGSGSTGGSHTVGVGDGGNGGTGTNDNGDPGNAPGGGGGGAIRDCIGWGCSDLEGGNGANGRVQITFRPTPTFSVSPTVNVCEDVEDVVYTTQSDAAISNYDWSLPGTAGIDFSIEAGGISISDHTVTVRWLTPGPKAVTVNYTVTAYGVSCDGESPASSTVTVDPVTRIETNLSTTAPPIVCEGGSFPALSVTASGTGTLSYQWYSNTSANTTGGTTIGTDSPTFTPPATTTGDLYYYVEVTGDCGPVATSLVSGVHTVTPLTTITTQPIGDAYCQNEAPTDLVVAATGTGIIDIEWFSNSSNSTTGATSVGTGTTFTPPTTTAETTYYFAVAASATCGSITSDIVEIEVTPETTIDTHPIGSVYCQNETPTDLSVVATGTGSIAYEWFSNTSNSTIGATSVGTGNTFTPPTTSDGSLFYFAVATSPTCGSATSDIVEIEVTPETTIVTQPSTTSQIDCIGTTFTPLSVTATGTSTLTYQWFSNSSATNIGGTAISGANSSTFTPPSITSGTLYYYVEISGGCGLAVSNASGAITVNPSTTIDSENLNSQAICDGGSFNPISVTASGTGTLHYQWYTNTSASTSGASPVGTDSPSYTPSAAVTGTNYYYVIVSSDCGSSIASNFSGAQTVQEITAISIQPDNSDDVECYGDGFNEISVSATGSGLTYQWYSNSSPITTGGTMVSGATLPNFTPPSVTLGSTYYYVVVTGNCGTETSTISGEYLVTPPITTITADPDPTPYSACLGVSFSPLSVNAIGEGAVTYQWYSNTSATNTGGTAIALATNSTFTPPSDTEGIIYYYATANSDCGTVPTAISGSYTVTPLTSIDSENLSPQTICEGETFDPISVVADGTNPIEFQWYSNSTNSNSGGTLISGANSEFFTPPTTSPGTSTYYYVIVSSFCGIDITSNVSGAMLVNANTSIDTNLNTTAPPIVCEGGSFPALSVTASGTGTLSYQWYSNTSANTTGGTTIGTDSPTFTPPATTTGDLYYYVEVTGDCGPVATSLVSGVHTVTPLTTITTQPIGDAYCQNEAPTDLVVAATGTGIIDIEWFSNSSNSTTGATSVGTGTTFTPPTTTAETTYYFAVAASATCGSITSDIVEIEVTPETTIDTHPIGSVYCQNETPTDLSVVATGTGSIAYEWFSNTSNSTIGATSVGTGNTFTPPTTSDGSLFYFAVATSPTCGSATSDIVEIEVTPTNTVTPASTSPELCINTTMPVINHTTTGATGIKVESDEVDYNLPNGVTATWESNVISITGTPAEEGIFNYSIPLEGGCGEIFAEGNITVTDPSYPISGINVDNPGLGDPLPATSTFTVYSPGLTLGTYTVNYSRTGANSGPDQNISVTVTTAGEFTFTSPSYSNEGSTILTINSIQKSTDLCPDYPTGAKTVLYGISCSVEFDRINGNQEFYVPANVTQVTIQVFGNGTGGNTDIHTMNVWPSGVIFAGFSGSDVFATEVPSSEPAATRIANAIINVTGPNGKVKFNYICDSTIPSCATLVDDGNSFIDSDGFTVIRFDNLGTCTWSAPEGLDEFEVLVIGGAGGGGYGNTAGGGAGGGVIYRAYSGITSTGDDGLQGASFTIQVGNGGAGGTGSIIRGATGNPSAFSAGTFDYSNVRNSIGGTLSGAGSFSSLTALGGGGGGSTGSRNGINGASGGGSASSWSGLFNTFIGIFGNGSIPQGQNGGSSYAINIFGVAGGAGGGGGGAGGPGSNGTNSLFGIAGIYGGNGGDGLPFNFTETTEYFGAGGGGTSSGEQGAGGSAGAGGNAVSGGAGQNGQTYGSGGGAGSSGGGAGFQGVVYIRYPNYRILPVEYLYFNATYNDFQRSGDLTWATAKEWENDRFEIERSVNNVKDWEAIGEVSGAGYSDAEVKYDYSDIKLPVAGGNIFYRLKQYDFDGDFTYSDTKSIKVEALPGTTHWRVFPNPTTGHPFNIEILDPSAYHDEPITLRIISATGQFHTIQVSEMRRMGTQVSEWFSAQASGIFTIEISWGDQREYHNVILRR